jgi:hypothetical protein
VLDKDSDNDGLKDWEEVLWKTDPQNSDTDGDGTPDGAEVLAGRDPLKKGPSDMLNSAPKVAVSDSTANPASVAESQNMTDNLAHDIAVNLGSAEQAGNLQDVAKNKIIPSLTATDSGVSQKYTPSDIHVATDDTLTTIRRYGNELGSIMQSFANLSSGEELTIVKEALAEQNEGKLADLAAIIGSYDALIKKYLALQVPASAVSLHTEILNLNDTVRQAIDGMSKVFEDPLFGIASVKAYRDTSGFAQLNLKNLQDYFRNHGVIFNKDEAGYVFNK